jgi:hypothetical protein
MPEYTDDRAHSHEQYQTKPDEGAELARNAGRFSKKISAATNTPKTTNGLRDSLMAPPLPNATAFPNLYFALFNAEGRV